MPLTLLPDVQHRGEDYELDEERARALWAMEERHFWHDARNRWILAALETYLRSPRGKVLEVGCGSGAVARALVGAGYDVTGVDTAELLVRRAHQRVPLANLVCGDIANLPPDLRGPYDAIGFFDVLEHLDDPTMLVRDALRYARPGTLVIATVPSQDRLYSVVDYLSGHKRRYEVSQLKALFERCGLRDVREHGVFRFLAPLIAARRPPLTAAERTPSLTAAEANRIMLRDFEVPAAPVNEALRTLCAVERRFFSASEDKPGASLLAVGWVPADEKSVR